MWSLMSNDLYRIIMPSNSITLNDNNNQLLL